MKGIEEAKAILKEMITPENADKISQVVANLDEANEENENLAKQHGELKDKYVDAVSRMTFRENPKDDIVPEHKTIDEIMTANLEKVVNARK